MQTQAGQGFKPSALKNVCVCVCVSGLVFLRKNGTAAHRASARKTGSLGSGRPRAQGPGWGRKMVERVACSAGSAACLALARLVEVLHHVVVRGQGAAAGGVGGWGEQVAWGAGRGADGSRRRWAGRQVACTHQERASHSPPSALMGSMPSSSAWPRGGLGGCGALGMRCVGRDLQAWRGAREEVAGTGDGGRRRLEKRREGRACRARSSACGSSVLASHAPGQSGLPLAAQDLLSKVAGVLVSESRPSGPHDPRAGDVLAGGGGAGQEGAGGSSGAQHRCGGRPGSREDGECWLPGGLLGRGGGAGFAKVGGGGGGTRGLARDPHRGPSNRQARHLKLRRTPLRYAPPALDHAWGTGSAATESRRAPPPPTRRPPSAAATLQVRPSSAHTTAHHSRACTGRR